MLTFTQGDDVVLNLTAQQGDGTKVDLTGATFETKMRGNNNTIVTFDNDKHTANPDQSGHRGEFTLTLDDEDTASVGVGENKEIVTKITIASVVIYFHGANQLNVLSDSPYATHDPIA